MQDLFELAGGIGLEDNHYTFSAKNHLKNHNDSQLQLLYPNATIARRTFADYPHLRVTGLVINVNIRYYNHKSTQFGSEHREEFNNNPICYVDVDVSPRWNSRPRADYVEGAPDGSGRYQDLYVYGITIHFQATGNYAFWDPIKIFAFIASAFVYFMIPDIIMALLTKFCLGNLSEVYYAAQFELYNYWDCFAGEVVRAIASLHCYKELQDVQQKEIDRMPHAEVVQNQLDHNFLSWNTIKRLIIELFEEYQVLDAPEINTLLSVLLKLLDTSRNRRVYRQSFVDQFVNNETTTLRNWADLFDINRRRCPLERIFDIGAAERRVHARHSQEEYHKAKRRQSQHEELERQKSVDMTAIEDTPQAPALAIAPSPWSDSFASPAPPAAPADPSSPEAQAVLDMITDIDEAVQHNGNGANGRNGKWDKTRHKLE
jgi:hypothetical protein